MADRDASFFGPILPQKPLAPEAFSFDELQRIRANRMAADLLRAGPSGWPERRRFRTMYPPAPGARQILPSEPTPAWTDTCTSRR
jgi:hypothetical protein